MESCRNCPCVNGLFQIALCLLESPLGRKEIKPVNPKGSQPWIFIWRTEAEAPIFWPPDVKKWLIKKDPDAAKDWRQKKKGEAKDEIVIWHYWLNQHDLSKLWEIVKDRGAQGAAVHGSLKESDTTQQLNNNNRMISRFIPFVTYGRASFFFKINNILLYVY